MKPIRKLLTDRKQALKTAAPKKRDQARHAYKVALICQLLSRKPRAA
jgi:hypothetical protein